MITGVHGHQLMEQFTNTVKHAGRNGQEGTFKEKNPLKVSIQEKNSLKS